MVEEQVLVSEKKSAGSSPLELTPLNQVKSTQYRRITLNQTGIHFDDLLGGGLVPAQVLLIGGEPGVGKSTLLLQLAETMPTVYVSGEESEGQILMRARRLKIQIDRIKLLNSREVNQIVSSIEQAQRQVPTDQPRLVIVDSIQSLYSTHIKSVAGSVAQVQYCATVLTNMAKKLGVILVIIGQVTKSGYVAGPKQLEHMVDTFLYMEGDRRTDLRLVRVVKNRFGPTGQVEIFQMTSTGFISGDEVLLGLIKDREQSIPGLVRTVVMEGQRPIVLEVEALNAPAQYGNARRVVNGVSNNRVQMLLAVLNRRVGIKTHQYDIYINVSGGLKVDDPAMDLPVCLAIASAVKNKPIAGKVVAFGEVGLLGDIKPVSFAEQRRNEARKMGYSTIVDAQQSQDLSVLIRSIFTG